MKRGIWWLIVPLVALVFTAGLTASPVQAADTIKIGAVQPIPGRFAFAGVNINAGLKDALIMANEAGGINHKKIEYIMEDGQYKLDVATAAFKRIMSRDDPVITYGESTDWARPWRRRSRTGTRSCTAPPPSPANWPM